MLVTILAAPAWSGVIACSALSPAEGGHPEGDGASPLTPGPAASASASAGGVAGPDADAGAPGSGTSARGSAERALEGGLSLALGANHSCALERGEVRCWGLNRSGMLGVSDRRSDPILEPQRVASLPPAVEIAADYDFTCARTEEGAVYCWGSDEEGQLGAPRPDRRRRPARIEMPSAEGIALGFRRGCALLGDGIMCWGSGRLGDGREHHSSAPLRIPGLGVGAVGVEQLELASGHACARSGGAVRCWGDNSRGQIGNGEGGCRYLRERCPHSRCLPPKECKEVLAPLLIEGLPEVVSLALGGSHSYALDRSGAVWSWGQQGTTMDFGEANPKYRPAVLEGLPPVVELQARGNHACGRTEAGALWCWGQNAFGELGHPPAPRGGVEPPSPVEGLPPARGIALGMDHTCAITGGPGSERVWCWGDNGHGELGDGTTERRHRPVEVRR